MTTKKGEFHIVFNWIYILIAGGMILLFFVGIAIKQKAVSEENLQTEIVQLFDSLFTSAGVSEKTKNFIDVSALRDYVFRFECEKGIDYFGIKGNAFQQEEDVVPLFSPEEIQTTQFITWSVPFSKPFKAADLLLVTSNDVRYVFVGDDILTQQALELTTGLTVDSVVDLASLTAEKYSHTRIVDFGGLLVRNGVEVPSSFRTIDEGAISAVTVSLDGRVFYFFNKNDVWKQHSASPLLISSLGEDFPSELLAAFIVQDESRYACSMTKAYKRLKLVTTLYKAKVEDVVNYYTGRPEPTFQTECLGKLTTYAPNIRELLNSLDRAIGSCMDDSTRCGLVSDAAQKLDQHYRDYKEEGCISLY
ncbi:TPA: hypothetical protein HA241_05270 [Candidatus Woesearchaeota archaeon]|nr:hypothetical protein [Candidatus Woesearchaeota archaeon]